MAEKVVVITVRGLPGIQVTAETRVQLRCLTDGSDDPFFSAWCDLILP